MAAEVFKKCRLDVERLWHKRTPAGREFQLEKAVTENARQNCKTESLSQIINFHSDTATLCKT